MWVFVFGSVYVMDYIYGFVYVVPALHLRGEAYFIMMDKLLDVLLQSVCQYFFDLSLFLMWAFIAINFPLDIALKVSQRFW